MSKKSLIPSGAVLCFVIYAILCGQIITLLENNWLTIPDNLQYSFNEVGEDGTVVKVKSNSTSFGACGLVGMCYPFMTGSVLDADLAVEFEPCHVYRNEELLGGQAGIIAISLYGVGLSMLTLAWIISICGCCRTEICGRNIIIVLTHFITLAFLLVGGGSVTWMFTWHEGSCATIYCNATPLFKNNCQFGWCLWVLSSVIIALFLTMLGLCASMRNHLASVKPKPSRRIPIQVAERPGNNTGFMFASTGEQALRPAGLPLDHRGNPMTRATNSTASQRSITRFPHGGPGVYGSVRLKEFYF